MLLEQGDAEAQRGGWTSGRVSAAGDGDRGVKTHAAPSPDGG